MVVFVFAGDWESALVVVEDECEQEEKEEKEEKRVVME